MESDEKKTKRTITGPSFGYADIYSKREMWKEIADEMKGEFKVVMTSGNVLEIHKISIPYKKWTIEISVSDTRPMKFQISFQSYQDFQLTIYWEDFLDRIRKIFRKPEAELGWNEFDKRYVVKSNKPGLVKEIMSFEIRKVFLEYNVYSLSIQPGKNKNAAELISVIQRNPGNKVMVLKLIDIFKLLIDNLIKSGIIE
jgi:hypothetical protein